MPPVLSMAIEDHHGEVDVKTAYVPGIESFAIKMSPGFFDNPKLGLPSTAGLMILLSAKTGMVEALLLDNGYLTDVRTAATDAVAAKYLARPDADTACIVGAGTQAKLQLSALCLVREIKRARSGHVTPPAKLAERLGIEVIAAKNLESAVRTSDVVVTTTPSQSPVVMADWLQPGQHVTAMGSDQHNKNELEPACLTRADLYVPDRKAQTEILGELHHALAAGSITADADIPELGDVVAGNSVGRSSAKDITVCDLTGTGVQDTAIATFARQRALTAGAGTTFAS